MVALQKNFFQKGEVWQFWPDFTIYVMAATLNILMKGISAEAYTLSILLLKAYSAALQRAPRHHCVSTLWDTVQIQLLLEISKIIKGTRQQRKDGRKKNMKEATWASCKQIHAHSSLLKGVPFPMWCVIFSTRLIWRNYLRAFLFQESKVAEVHPFCYKFATFQYTQGT